MKRLKAVICFLLILTALCGLLTGCYDNREIDDLAYVVAIGFDEGITNYLRITFQIAKPGAAAGQSGSSSESDGGGDKPFIITTVEAPTLYSALNMVNTYINRQITLSNAVALIFSKSMAEKGIEHLTSAISRTRECRPNMYVVVSRTTAEEYINNIKPALEKNPAKYYQLNYTGYRYTSYTANAQFHYFSTFMDSPDRQPVAILAGINKFESSDNLKIENSTFAEKGRTFPLEGDFLAGDIPRIGENKGEIMGLAVFDGEKMVGTLDGEETAYYLMVSGEYRNAYWTFIDPKEKGSFVLLNIRQSRTPKRHVTIVDGKPHIYVKLLLEADISSIQSGINYEKGENSKTLETYASDFLDKGITKMLEKTATEYHSDIFGMGSAIRGNFLTWREFENFKWKTRYKDSVFSVDVNIKIRRPGLMVRSSKAVNSLGEGGLVY